jgi:putative ABC transport system permease protein
MIAFVPAGSFTIDYYTACYISVKDAEELDTYTEAYDAAVQAVADRLEAISAAQTEQRRAQVVDDANATLADAKQEFETKKADAEAQIAEAEAQLEAAEAQLTSAKEELDRGEQEYTDGQAALEQQKQALPDQMTSGADEILVNEESVLDFEDQLRQMRLLVELEQVTDPLLAYAQSLLDNAQAALDEATPEDKDYEHLREALASAQELKDSFETQLAGYQAQLDDAKRQLYAQGLVSAPDVTNDQLVSESEEALRQMKLALLEGQLSISTGTASAYVAFDAAQQQLDAARAQLDAGWTEYNDGMTQLAEGRQQLAEQKAAAEAQLADAQQQLTDAEERVDEIAAGEWYVLDRDTITSFVTFEQNADRIAAIARVFPVFFFLVAALVATTTMTRMVEENRLQMGTLKALGYSEGAIAAKYLTYGIAASLLGSVAGILVGFAGFPSVIWYAYSIMYNIPGFRIIFYPRLIVVSVVISAAIIGAATWAACRASLREKTAALLLPRAPAAGKRIILERIKPLWAHMSFSQKTTARNLLRYKKRFFMTVLGVAGCTALLLVGFGLQDSIMDVVDKQYSELYFSDLTISLTSDKALDVEHGVTELLNTDTRVQSWGVFYSRTMSVYNADGQEANVTVLAARDAADMTQYFNFRTRQGHAPIAYDESSVILTEKTAENLGVAVGDTIWVANSDGVRVPLVLTGVTENYLFTRLYLSGAQLRALEGEDVTWNAVLAATTCETDADTSALSEAILAKNYISSVTFAEAATSTFSNIISCINYVVLLVIVCAAALAAVVLYNLINVNLAERKKELATIKVLGFYDKEVYRYIFREIELLSLIGAFVGLAIGVPLHQFIIRTVEIDQMMFIRSIAPSSYVYSVALTMVFALAMCVLMRRQVKNISMVESMKAPE